MSTVRLKFTAICLSAATLALHGCLSVPVNLRTNPAGATVLANGKAIGTTPMQVSADRLFPHQRKGLDWHREGTLTLERPGCTPKTMDVDNDLLKRSLTVDLECRPDAPVTITPTARPAATSAAGPSTGATAQRLEELEGLRRQGLITAEEYRSIRRRILDQL